MLLLAFLLSCKPEKVKFPEEIDGSGQHLTNGNIEIPGTDVSTFITKLPVCDNDYRLIQRQTI